MGTIINCSTGEIIVEPMTEQEIIEDAWAKLRLERNQRLVGSDLYVMSDRWEYYTEEQRTAWAAYRQALRDLPENTTDPFNVIWPEKP